MTKTTTYRAGDVVTRKGYVGDVARSYLCALSRREVVAVRWRHTGGEGHWFASDVRPAPLRHWQAA